MGSLSDRRRRDSATASRLWLGASACYFLLAAATIKLTSNGLTIATVWPANAILVSLLLLGPLPRWATVLSAGLVGNLAANWITRGTVTGPLFYSVANGLEVVIAVLLLRADARRFNALRSTSRLLRFIVVAGVAAPLSSGLLGAGTAALIYEQPFGTSLTTWMLSDALGLLVFTPVFHSLFNGDVARYFTSKTTRKREEAFALFMSTAVVSWLIFFVASLPALFVLYAPVMLVTFRVGSLGTKMAVMIIAVIGAYATAIGAGPVAMISPEPEAQAHMFQAFLAVMMLTCLPVAAEIEERNRLAAELLERQHQASQEALTDALTGILNRRGFEQAANDALRVGGTDLYFVAIDIDRFKPINDRWGHQFGDRVLRHIAKVLRANTRPGDLVGRLGGDEFALILRATGFDTIEAVCARMQAALLSSPISPDGHTKLMIGISCGAAAVIAGDRLDCAYQRADAALYAAKAAGRNTFRLAIAG